MTIFIICTAYIVLMFAVFFILNILFDFDEGDEFYAALASVAWPVTTIILVICGMFWCTHKLARAAKLRIRKIHKRKGRSE